MISLQLTRENPDLVREALKKRQNDTSLLDEILDLDKRHRSLLRDSENLRATQNRLSKTIGYAKSLINKGSWTEEELNRLIHDAREQTGYPLGSPPITTPDSILELLMTHARNLLLQRIDKIIEPTEDIEKNLNELLLYLPNIPHPDVPVGKDAGGNTILRTWGEKRHFDFEPKPHWDLGGALGIIDFARGVKLSGTRFYVLKGWGARLQRSLIAFMLDLHTQEHGYTEIYPPFMVKKECMVGSGNLPKFADNLYHDEQDDFWFVPTAEVPLTNLHRDEILEPSTLPLYYVAYTACFRREKMAAGKDTRGIKRGHQFDKVELYKFVEPDSSDAELEKLVGDAQSVCQKLGLTYRIVQLCTGDLGFAAVKSYDIEVWAPGCREWLEVSSCSNCGDFQARRANIRYRPSPGARPQFVHTLNGSGLALPRIVISILENYQQDDGSMVVPEVLRPYMGIEIIK